MSDAAGVHLGTVPIYRAPPAVGRQVLAPRWGPGRKLRHAVIQGG